MNYIFILQITFCNTLLNILIYYLSHRANCNWKKRKEHTLVPSPSTQSHNLTPTPTIINLFISHDEELVFSWHLVETFLHKTSDTIACELCCFADCTTSHLARLLELYGHHSLSLATTQKILIRVIFTDAKFMTDNLGFHERQHFDSAF